jgi:hypothetical protein
MQIKLYQCILLHANVCTHMLPTAMSVFIRASDPLADIRYTLDGSTPTLDSPKLTYDTPYIHIDTPFNYGRKRTMRAIAVVLEIDSLYSISAEITRTYYVEASDRSGRTSPSRPGR